jgi:type I restriction enzyme S subunit
MSKQYEKYKESGLGWLGIVPDHWIISKAKYISDFRMGQTILKEDLLENGSYSVYSATEGDHFFGKINNPSFFLEEGDIVIPARGNSIGHIKLVSEKSVSTQTTIANFINKNKINSSFLFYLYKGFRFIYFHFDNTAIPQITVDQVKENIVLIPPKEEQTQIALYLDYQTNIIDQLINKKQKLIELLKEKRQAIINEAVTKGLNPNAKMKDSGIEWLGEVPEDWVITPFRFIADKIGSGVTPKGGAEVYTDEGVIFIRSQNVHFDGLRLDDVAKIDIETHQKMSNSKVQINDVLLNITGASIGRCCVVNIDEEMNVNQHVCIIRPKSNKVISQFLNLVLQSEIGQTQVRMELTGGNRDGLTFESLKAFVLALPNITEQAQIVSQIELQIDNFKKMESNVVAQIEKLKEYRQSIISEAVTGKIDVRDWQPN